MGFADLFPENKWILDASEDGGPTIEGEFTALNVVENISGKWSEQSTLGMEQPVLQFICGELETITLDVKVWAKWHDPTGLLSAAASAIGLDPKWSDILEHVDEIKNLARKNPDIGRPHIYLFSLGSQLVQTVVVKSVGGIRYDRVRPLDGTLRGVLFSLTLARYVPYGEEAFSGQTNESLVVFAYKGETYEGIAERVYGDPVVGEALRRRNPDKTELEAGDQIHVPPARTLSREVKPLTPQSLFLKRAEAQRDVLIDVISVRGASVDSFILTE
jgi:hypothetical protein